LSPFTWLTFDRPHFRPAKAGENNRTSIPGGAGLVRREKLKDNIYRTGQSEKIVKDLYDSQVESLEVEYEDLYVNTRFGKTHVLKAGNSGAEPVLLFHGGNSTAPFSLGKNLHLIQDHLVYAPDTIGHPGKSEQRVLSSKTLEYGQWAADVIDSLGFQKMICMGESFGGGILAKLMCVAPGKISKAILLVPAGIYNAPKSRLIISMGVPMLLYLITRREKWFEKAFMPMMSPDEPIDRDTIEMIRTTFHHVKVNPNMPSNVRGEDIKEYQAPTLLLAGEKDVLFPGEPVLKRAREIIPNVETHLLQGCGHLYFSSEQRKMDIKKKVGEFLRK